MKLVVQKVTSARVSINNQIHNSISQGILVYLGVSKDCSKKKVEEMTQKLLKLKIFPDLEWLEWYAN